MKKGIVLDVNDDFVTMLTPDGEFVKTKNTKANYEIGEEITFFPINERVRNGSNPRFFQVKKWRYALASSLIAILFLSLFIPFSPRNDVYAYMSIDINPSFEVGLDDSLQVVSLEALNDEAKKLLESIPDWKNSTLDSITDQIIQYSKDNGYLKDGKQVLITTVVTDTHDTEVDRELKQGIEELKEEYKKEQIAVTSITSTVEKRKVAQEKGISTGKLLIEEDKVPEPVQEKKAQPVRQEKKNQQDNASEKIDITEFKNTQKQRAEEVQDKLKEKKDQINDKKNQINEKKEQIKEKVKNNIENSNMPAHLKEKKTEKIEEKWEKRQQKQEEKWGKWQQKQEENDRDREDRWDKKENNRGKDREHDDDDD